MILHAIQFLPCSFGEFDIGSSNNLLIDIFLNFPHLSAKLYIDIIVRNSLFVTCESLRVQNLQYSMSILPSDSANSDHRVSQRKRNEP